MSSKKPMRNALKKKADRQSAAIQFRLTPSEKRKLGASPNKKAKAIVLGAINE
jgi:hypothetical protein